MRALLFPPPSTGPPTPAPVPQPATGRGHPRSAHLCARLQPLVHLVDPILRLDHVRRVSPVEGSERWGVERVVGWVGHGGSWRGARRDFNIQWARQRTWERDALRRPPVGSSRCRGWAALCKLACLVRRYSVELEEEEAREEEGKGEGRGVLKGGRRRVVSCSLKTYPQFCTLAKFKSALCLHACVRANL